MASVGLSKDAATPKTWPEPLARPRSLIGVRPAAVASLASLLLALSALSGCSSSEGDEQRPAPVPAAALPTAQAVSVTVGHCFVAPVSFRGQEWAVPLALNYGGDGGQFRDVYEDWQGNGEIRLVDPTRARYRDAGGSEMTVRPVSYLERYEGELARTCD